MFRSKLISLFLLAALVLSACAPAATPAATPAPAASGGGQATPAPANTSAPAAPEPKDKESFVQMTFGDPQTLDPHTDYESAGAAVLQNIYENLVTFDGASPTKFVPLLAEAIPTPVVNGDGSVTYTWQIKDGVKFQNGDTLTAEDVAYSMWRTMMGDSNTPSALMIEPFFAVQDVTLLVDASGALADDHDALVAAPAAKLQAACEKIKAAVTFDETARTVSMTLVRPWGPFLNTLAGGPWGAIVDKQWVAGQGEWDGDCATWQNYYGLPVENGKLVNLTNGTGPYVLDHWTPEDEIVLTANADYWRGAAALKRVVIKNVTEFGTRFAALQAGDADGISIGSKADEVQMDTLVRDECDLATGACQTVNPDGILRAYRHLVPTSRTNAFFTFQIADSSTLVGSGLLDGAGIPRGFFSDPHVRKAFNYCFDWDTYIKDVQLGDAAQSLALTLPGQPGYDGAPAYSYDLSKCAEEFKASTLTSADGASLWDTGFYLQLAYNTGNTQRQSVAEILAAGLAQVNPKFFVAPVAEPWPLFLASQRAKALPLFISGWGEDIHDPHNWYAPHLLGNYAARQNLPADLKAKYKTLIDEGAVELDQAKRAEIYSRLNQLVYDDAPEIILSYQFTTRYEPLYLQGWADGLNANPLINSNTNNYYFYQLSK
jgi:peptide/nickel transport system substrate-binding protein